MKNVSGLILTVILTIAFHNPLFSQINNPYQLDTNFSSLIIDGKFDLKGIYFNKKQNESNKLFSIDPTKDPDSLSNYLKKEESHSRHDHMPILNIQGNHSMPIYEPDSSQHYSLLVKRG